MKMIDAMGKACPLPVIQTRKALKETTETLCVEVDNEIATQNLTKMAEQLGLSAQTKKVAERHYQVTIARTEGDAANEVAPVETEEVLLPKIVVIGSDQMGSGDTELGETLLRNFLFACSEQEAFPTAILFYNRGAFLTTARSKSLQDLQKMAAAGTWIATCGICLDFYGLTEELAVGEITNMYRIVELMQQYPVIEP
ncbi:sulfurtransferase-like selenium metabolism protein YedF [Listeria costaricensis]|uniref:sulfurtransferase-like selenium metabolism protein YedF n=1 Tax=Listeria costaricensis TaxID=2026604 RepID=UPI000C07A8D2|nr:sulfurtransferase-like selenium metabolism protein YedF [Listeria costaricensis]